MDVFILLWYQHLRTLGEPFKVSMRHGQGYILPLPKLMELVTTGSSLLGSAILAIFFKKLEI